MSPARSSQNLQSQSSNSSSLCQEASSSPLPPPSLLCSNPAVTECQTKQAVAGSVLCFEYFNPIHSIEQSPASSPISTSTSSIEQSSLLPSQDLTVRELKAAASARDGI